MTDGSEGGGIIIIIIIIIGLVLLILLAITKFACPSRPIHPLFHVGDCVAHKPVDVCESWEVCNEQVFKIAEIGKEHYRARYHFRKDEDLYETTFSFTSVDDYMQKVNCPKNLEE